MYFLLQKDMLRLIFLFALLLVTLARAKIGMWFQPHVYVSCLPSYVGGPQVETVCLGLSELFSVDYYSVDCNSHAIAKARAIYSVYRHWNWKVRSNLRRS